MDDATHELERLVAVDAIRSLIARYARDFDDHDWADFEALWAEDACFVADGVAFEGRDGLVEFLSACLPDDYFGKHMNSPSLIEVDADLLGATAVTDVLWITQNFQNSIIGRYNDRFVKRDGRWLFLRREESEIEFRDGPPPMSEAAAAVSRGTKR
jgi:uncharacterized protein (TIGR02246 family)